MAQIIGVKFKDTGKIYYFDPCDVKVSIGQMVIVETSNGKELGRVVLDNRFLSDDKLTKDLKKLVRVANKKDLEKLKSIRLKEKKAGAIFNDKLKKYNLEMNLIDVDCVFDGSKIIFYFTADKRVDFRNFVKELAAIFKLRIELRQVGVRDETRILGGIGNCGNPVCCSTFLRDFQPVSIKMAKEQGISLNPAKISGMCGRLMCCLNYEQDIYSELLKKTPKIGCYVKTPQGNGIVKDFELLKRIIKVQMDNNKDGIPLSFDINDISIIDNKKNNI